MKMIKYRIYRLVTKNEDKTTPKKIKSPTRFRGLRPYRSEALGKTNDPLNVPIKNIEPIKPD